MSKIRSIFSKIKSLSLKKKILLLVVLLIVALVLVKSLGSKKDSGYVLEPVKKATIKETVSETGNLSTGSNIDVVSPTTGVVTEIYVANGQSVEEGEVLFKVESSASEQEQAAAYANYLTAQNALNTATAGEHTLRAAMYQAWDTYYNLATGDTYENGDGQPKDEERKNPEFQIAQDNWAAAEKEYKDQQTAVAQAQASVNSTWLSYQATQNAEVKANTAGTIANLAVSDGKSIKADSPALTITTSLGQTYVDVVISEIDIPKIHEGQKTVVEVDAIDDKKYEGVVDRVDSVGTNTQGVITYNVYIKLLENDPNFRTGMTANAEIETKTAENVLSVPNSAVKPYQGGRAVQVIDKKTKKPKYIPVTVGIKGEERTEIVKGLSEGQEIIVASKNDALKRSSIGF